MPPRPLDAPTSPSPFVALAELPAPPPVGALHDSPPPIGALHGTSPAAAVLVYYHARCPDGFAAALAAWLHWGETARYQPLEHGEIDTVTLAETAAGRLVYLLDFALDAAALHTLADAAAQVIVIDHHRSARDALLGFSHPRVHLCFDLDQSGAALAWRYFWPQRAQPALVAHVQDRDLWRWALPDSGGFLAALDLEPWDWSRWQALCELDAAAHAAYVARGEAMEAKFRALADQLAQAAMPVRLGGVAGLMVNAPGAFHSRVGDLLAARSGTFALLWTVEKPGLVKCGLRSRAPFDCIPLAHALGGGGHAQACGFRLPTARLGELLAGELALTVTPRLRF